MARKSERKIENIQTEAEIKFISAMGDSVGIFRVSMLACPIQRCGRWRNILFRGYVFVAFINQRLHTDIPPLVFGSSRVLSPAGDLLTSAYDRMSQRLKFVFLSMVKIELDVVQRW